MQWVLAVVTALAFGLQLLCCFRVGHPALKPLPAYLTVIIFVYGLMTYAGVLGSYSAGAISGNQLAGLVVMLTSGFAAAGDAAAWVVWLLAKNDGKK